MSAVLEVRSLTVQYGPVRAVDEVTFDLGDGEILGVIGPNGAGKTTMFDAISGFVPSRGRVALGGHDISDASPAARSRAGLGRSFQDARLFPSLTVAETLSVAFERHIHAQDVVSTALRLPWVIRAERRVRTKVDELIELMGLGAFRDKFVSELSTGSRRIVDLAVIMAHAPKVLLLDEPSSGIAQRETEALAPLLLRLRDETGASLIVIEHDMPLIQAVSDELLALETGAVLARGAPADVLDDPRLVAAYLGTDQAAISRSGAPVTSSNGATPSKRATTRSAARRVNTNAAKKAVATKARPTKAAAKKARPTKTTAKKTAAKKTAAKKVVATKARPTRTAAKKVATTKASPTKTAAKKTAVKKAGPARSAPGAPRVTRGG